jgi:hypothetical protein
MDKGIDRPGGDNSGAKGGNSRTGSPGVGSCKSSLGMQSVRAVVWGNLQLFGLSVKRAKHNRQSKPRSRHAICCGGGVRWRGVGNHKFPITISQTNSEPSIWIKGLIGRVGTFPGQKGESAAPVRLAES